MTKNDAVRNLVNKAASLENHNETTTSREYEYEVPPAGKTVGRFIEYIEFGSQPQKPYKGNARKPAEEVRIVFELTHPKNRHEVGEGKDKVVYNDKITLILTKAFSEKAKFKKLYEKMRRNRQEITHIAQMLGEAFVFDVVHNQSADGTKTYANIYDKGNFLVDSPVTTDPITEETKTIAVPEALSELRVFIWDLPNRESWDSLFIDGTRKKTINGKEVEVSKNWIQEKITSALNFQGSAIQDMLVESAPEPEVKTEAKPTSIKSKVKPLNNVIDPLAALGLDTK